MLLVCGVITGKTCNEECCICNHLYNEFKPHLFICGTILQTHFIKYFTEFKNVGILLLVSKISLVLLLFFFFFKSYLCFPRLMNG